MKSAFRTLPVSLFRAGGLLLSILVLATCTSDQLPEPEMADCTTVDPTYTTDVKTIIDASCAYSGCHLDSSPGRFDSYSGLLPYLEDNTFRQRVLIERGDPSAGMPPDYAPDTRPRDLSEEQLMTIECWLDAGFPE